MEDNNLDFLIPEQKGINIKNENSLHSDIKKWYAKPEDRLEAKVDNYIIDILRDDLLIEIQTSNFCAIRKKLYNLTLNHKVRLIYPIPIIKNIINISPIDGGIVSKRKSPKKGDAATIFNELIRIPDIINNNNISIQILFIHEDDYICKNGKGGYRRKGAVILDKKLVKVLDTMLFETKYDFMQFIPCTINYPFTCKDLAVHGNYTNKCAGKIAYCLKKMGLIEQCSKKGNAYLYNLAPI